MNDLRQETTKATRFELWETNHGVDGYDAKRTLVARFTTEDKAKAWLKARQFTHVKYDEYYHALEKERHKMGMITYRIVDLVPPMDLDLPKPIPVDPGAKLAKKTGREDGSSGHLEDTFFCGEDCDE